MLFNYSYMPFLPIPPPHPINNILMKYLKIKISVKIYDKKTRILNKDQIRDYSKPRTLFPNH